jgi:hypothetical protein
MFQNDYGPGCVDIEVPMSAHHLIHGEQCESDRFNWLAKAEATRDAASLLVEDFAGGYQDFRRELLAYPRSPQAFHLQAAHHVQG